MKSDLQNTKTIKIKNLTPKAVLARWTAKDGHCQRTVLFPIEGTMLVHASDGLGCRGVVVYNEKNPDNVGYWGEFTFKGKSEDNPVGSWEILSPEYKIVLTND